MRSVLRVTAAAVVAAATITASLLGAGGSIPSAPRPEDVGFASERLPRIHETVQRYLDSKQLAGAVTLVARRGKVAHFEAHGDRKSVV